MSSNMIITLILITVIIVMWLLIFHNMNKCEHEYKSEGETTSKDERGLFLFKTKHYLCKKCLSVKNVRIGV